MQLSQNRSNTIRNTLIENGVQDSRLNTRAFGENKPNYPNVPLSERKKNRRVILSINMDL
jgi:OOP family OmpA-OmpF porin